MATNPAAPGTYEPLQPIPVTSYVPYDLDYAENYTVLPGVRFHKASGASVKDVKDSEAKGCL